MFHLVRRIGAKLSSLAVHGLVRRAARRQGFMDPFPVMERLRHLAQPSEVNEPIELLRAAAVFHARGLINARAIQHNLDWVWPFWVRRQFDPRSSSFITRGFSATHVNLTHRNWTAVGLPDCPQLPIVDPRGLVTPFHDGWSLDAWVIGDSGQRLVPSECGDCEQRYALTEGVLTVDTILDCSWARLEMNAAVTRFEGVPTCVLQYTVSSRDDAWLAVSLRPYNPEGISEVGKIEYCTDEAAWLVNHRRRVVFGTVPERRIMSDYWAGDVSLRLQAGDCTDEDHVSCRAGMATAAALFRAAPGAPQTVEIRIPLENVRNAARRHQHAIPAGRADARDGATQGGVGKAAPQKMQQGTPPQWDDVLDATPRLTIPDERMAKLYRQCLYSLVLHSPGEVYPGPFTYKRFWFRDASFILNALLNANLHDRVRRCLNSYPSRQTITGYFHSQDGEWDSNGEALWILDQYYRTTGERPDARCLRVVSRGADWIRRKRSEAGCSDCPHAGLLPSGFSAEHLGPNDYYYWDNFWSVAGLQCAARLLAEGGRETEAARFREVADELLQSVDASLAHRRDGRDAGEAYPASPYRRMDSGAVGSIVASYPLGILSAENSRLRGTTDFLLDNCRVKGGFFQENIHSGINAYLTLHLAQVLLRAGDPRYFELVDVVANLATSAGQWPEAVHPITDGGCMGDGHHVWASAEWFMMLRNMFLREEGDSLILCSGIPKAWLESGEEISFGPASSLFGTVFVSCHQTETGAQVRWRRQFRTAPSSMKICLPGHLPQTVENPAARQSVDVSRISS